MHILLFQDNQEAAEKSLFLIETKYAGTVTIVANPIDAMKALENSSLPVDLMVVDCTTISLISETRFWEISSKTKTLLAEQSAPEELLTKKNDNLQIVKRLNLIESMTRALDLLAKTAPAPLAQDGPSYCRIKAELLLSVAPLKGDIFIRLSGTKYVKIFNEGDEFNLDDLNKYTIRKGIDYLYLLREQSGEFAKKYVQELSKILSNSPSTAQISINAMEQGNEVVRQLYKTLGFTKEVQEIAKSQALLTVKVIGKSPNLGVILEKIKTLKGSYLSNHSTYTSFVCCAIASIMDWGSDTTFYKLSLASILHDLALDSDELAAINSLAELEDSKGKFKEEEIKAYKEHPQVVSELVKAMPGAPPEVDLIILQHHEFPDGTGFPRKLNQKFIASLAALFIIGHEITQAALKQGTGFKFQNYIKGVSSIYTLGSFRKIMIVLEKSEWAKK